MPPKSGTTQSTARPKIRGIAIAKEWLKSAGAGLIVFLIVRAFVLQTFTIVSGSMEATLLVGDFLMVNKVAYGATIPVTEMRLPGYDDPEIGHVVVFRGPHEPLDIVKRIVGGPGDTLEMRSGQLIRNGRTVEEPYVIRKDPGADLSDSEMRWQLDYLAEPNEDYRPSRNNWGPIVVPSDHYFMMGDNRDESRDSRYWGLVPAENLIGKATFIYFSWERRAGVGTESGVRWNRIGDRIR